MKLEDLVGKTVKVVAGGVCGGVVIGFDDGSQLSVGEGNGGTMRDPEPYFYCDVQSEEELNGPERKRVAEEAYRDSIRASVRNGLSRIWPGAR